MSEEKTKDYEADIIITMPGQTRQSVFTIPVPGASCRAEATGRAEDAWQEYTAKFDMRLREVDPNAPPVAKADGTAPQQKSTAAPARTGRATTHSDNPENQE